MLSGNYEYSPTLYTYIIASWDKLKKIIIE